MTASLTPVAPSSSSTKKAARLAQKGKGQKVRFQGGALFPFVVALVLVLGVGLIVYARQTRPAADASAPTIDDHWHHAYGFYLCDQWVSLTGSAEEADANGVPVNREYLRTGIHSHDDGLMHWHPGGSSAAVGRRAQLGVFLDVYDVELSDDELVFPEDQRAQLPAPFAETGVFEAGETQCSITDADGDTTMEDARLRVVRWDSIDDTGDGTTFISGFDQIALDQDGMAVAIAFVPDGTDIEKPPSVNGFQEAALSDSGQLAPDDLFEGVETNEDGDLTVNSVPLDDVESGPAVDDPDPDDADLPVDSVVESDTTGTDPGEPVASGAPADEAES